jgi:hypothetical protein
MQLHDSYVFSLSMTVTSEATSPTELTVQLDIGGTGSVSNVVLTHFSTLGKSVPYTLEMTSGAFVTSTMLTNGATIYVKTDTGSVDVNDVTLLIQRVHGGTDW